MSEQELNFDHLTDEEIHLLLEDVQGLTVNEELVRCHKLIRTLRSPNPRYFIIKGWIERLSKMK